MCHAADELRFAGSMPTTRWTLIVSKATDDALRQLLAAVGRARKGELSRFVEEAVLARINEAKLALPEAIASKSNEPPADHSAVSVRAPASRRAVRAGKQAQRR